jgi:hypothetical protein
MRSHPLAPASRTRAVSRCLITRSTRSSCDLAADLWATLARLGCTRRPGPRLKTAAEASLHLNFDLSWQELGSQRHPHRHRDDPIGVAVQLSF